MARPLKQPPTYEEWKKENWDKAHQEKDMTALTGTGIGGHLNTLHVKDLFRYDATILCIGVGAGDWVAEASEIAQEVWALDVSALAQKSIPRIVKFTTDPKRLPSNTFDLVMSLWVAPHMNDADLQTQLTEVVRSLKVRGVFAIHYKEPLTPNQIVDNREGQPDEYVIARRAGMLRTPERFNQMVATAGGYIISRVQEMPSQFHKIIEVSSHIGKRSCP